jgi:hypothetical protein
VNPNPGDIGLVAIKGRVGLAIRFGQWLNGSGLIRYEHAFVYVGDGQVIEAEPEGARLALLNQYDGCPLMWLRCPPQYGEAVAAAARAMRGVPYSFADYGALALHRLHIPAPHLRAYIETSKRDICSQLCDQAAMMGGWKLFDDGRWCGFVAPGDLYRLAGQQVASGV